MNKIERQGLSLAAGLVFVIGTGAASAQTPRTPEPPPAATGTTDTTGMTTTTKTKSGTSAATTTTMGQTPKSDAGFIKKVAVASMAEVDMGRVGTEKAASSEVKQYAQKIVDEHTKANNELKDLANTKSVELPAVSEKHNHVDKVSDKAGADFDKAFMKMMVSDHKKVVRTFEKEAKNGKDPDVKAWAQKMLPTLREHLQEAETIYGTVKSTTPDGTRTTTKTSS